MQEDHQGLQARIGTRLRASRAERRWTLDDMAERSGVSRRMVVNIEKGRVNAGVATLLRLADALEVALSTLVAPPMEGTAAITRRGDGATLWTSPSGGAGTIVSGSSSPDALTLWHWTLKPGDEFTTGAHLPGTRQILHVLKGSVTLSVSDDTTDLQLGDAMTFAGDQPHSYQNAGSSDAEFTVVVAKIF